MPPFNQSKKLHWSEIFELTNTNNDKIIRIKKLQNLNFSEKF